MVAKFCLATRSRRKSGTIWRLQWVEGQSESGHGKRYPRLIGMSPGGGVRLLIVRFRRRLRRYAVADTVEYEADAMPDQLPNTRGYGGGRLGMEIKLPFPGGAEYAIPVCFVENGYRTTPAAHALMACNFGNVD